MDSLSRAALTGAAGGGEDPAWDITTLAMRETPINAIVFRDIPDQYNATGPTDIAFKPDGTKFYICDRNRDFVGEYDLSTAWDISTFSYVQQFDISGKETNPFGLDFSSDGTKMYVVGLSGAGGAPNDAIHQWNLSTAWDVSTATFVDKAPTNPYMRTVLGFFIKSDGLELFGINTETLRDQVVTLSFAI